MQIIDSHPLKWSCSGGAINYFHSPPVYSKFTVNWFLYGPECASNLLNEIAILRGTKPRRGDPLLAHDDGQWIGLARGPFSSTIRISLVINRKINFDMTAIVWWPHEPTLTSRYRDQQCITNWNPINYDDVWKWIENIRSPIDWF